MHSGTPRRPPLVSKQLPRIVHVYQSTAVIFLNTLLLFVFFFLLLNVGLHFLFKVYDARFRMLNPIQKKYHEFLPELYPGMDGPGVNALLTESWSRNVIYQPFTG